MLITFNYCIYFGFKTSIYKFSEIVNLKETIPFLVEPVFWLSTNLVKYLMPFIFVGLHLYSPMFCMCCLALSAQRRDPKQAFSTWRILHRTYIALVSWVLRRLLTGPDAWLRGTDTAPSGSSPPPHRGHRSQGVPTVEQTQRSRVAAAAAGGVIRWRTAVCNHRYVHGTLSDVPRATETPRVASVDAVTLRRQRVRHRIGFGLSSYLCCLSEDEFRVLHQTLQRHGHIDDLCPLVFSTVVSHKLAVPGVEDDEAWFNETASERVWVNWRRDVLMCFLYYMRLGKFHKIIISGLHVWNLSLIFNNRLNVILETFIASM